MARAGQASYRTVDNDVGTRSVKGVLDSMDALQVLILEDSPDDAEQMALELRHGGLEIGYERVDSRETLDAALARGGWDVIIADYVLPGFDALAALQMVKDLQLDIPFIVVSGVVGEETAVQAVKAGAHDYVLKQSLTRLGVAVSREVLEAQVRRERTQAVTASRILARRTAFLAQASGTLVASLDFEETLELAARVPLGEIADWCILSVPGTPDASASLRAVLSHLEPRRETWARQRLGGLALDPLADRGAAQVIRTGRHAWLPADAVLVTLPDQSREALALVRALGHDSALCLPLTARGETLGAMTLVRASPRASLSHHDLGFAQELAARAALALDNSALYRRAREAVRVRDEFLCIASHELNTPLATLSLQLDSLMRFGARGPRERILKAVVQARRQVGRLCRLVESLLDVTQIDTGRLRLRPTQVDLVATAREVVDQLSPDLSRAGCVVNVEAPASVIGHWDPTRIAQVLLNLLFNAFKYGAGRPIEVIIHAESDRASLSVRDRGIGIAPEDLGRLFGRFERAAPFSNYGGLGLGLYITRHIIEAHGGTIRVASTVGRGTTFAVELPLHQPSLSVEGEMPRAAETPSEASPRP